MEALLELNGVRHDKGLATIAPDPLGDGSLRHWVDRHDRPIARRMFCRYVALHPAEVPGISGIIDNKSLGTGPGPRRIGSDHGRHLPGTEDLERPSQGVELIA